MMGIVRPSCLFLVLALLSVGTSSAQGPPDPEESRSLLRQARIYSASFGVDVQEAFQRLQLQRTVGELNDVLTAREGATFAGLWIQHTPEFRVIARFTDSFAHERIRRYVEASPLADLVEVQPAVSSLEELQTDQASAVFIVKQLKILADAGINVYENRAELYVLEEDRLWLEVSLAALGLRLPETVEVVTVTELSAPEANLYAGFGLSTCTVGFAVANSGGTRGILTAGHCGNSQSFAGQSLPFQSERCGGSYDVQWHTASGFTVKGWVRAGCITRVTGTRSRSNQSVGEHVCKTGKTTGITCGTINDKNFLPNLSCSTNATFIRVAGGTTNLSEGGDSGGPWYSGGNAYGVHICGFGNDSCYMPIDFISVLGVSVITSDPLTCGQGGQICFSGADCCCGYCSGVGGGLGVCIG